MNEPIVFDKPESGLVKPLLYFGIEEVKNASSQGLSVGVPFAIVENWRQHVVTMELTNISAVTETVDGFSFVGICYQLVTKLVHDYDVVQTYELIGRKSLCKVEVRHGAIALDFATSEKVHVLTGAFSPERVKESLSL